MPFPRCLVWVALLALFGCGSTSSLTGLHGTVDSLHPAPPSVEEYQMLRASLVGGMKNALAEQETAAGSSAGKIRKIVVGAGALIGLGGTLTSLVVDDEDTKSTIAQVSGGVAGVAGLVGLLPFGSGAQKAGKTASYLRQQIPRFEKRWPESLEVSPTPEEWIRFQVDAESVTSTLLILDD